MSEPELPGIPPPPAAPWYRRIIRRVFGPWKLPGWGTLILFVIIQVPDWKGRLDFWLDAAREASIYTFAGAAVISSPYFSVGLALAGVAWLVFVGEPEKGVQRHRWLPYLGWGFVSLCLTAIVVTGGWGAVQIYIAKEVSRRDQSLQQRYATRPTFWHLTDYNRATLTASLKQVPKDQKFVLQIICLPDASSRTFVDDIGSIFVGNGWEVKANCLFNNLRADFLGIGVGFSPTSEHTAAKDLPGNALLLRDILSRAKIPFVLATNPGLKGNDVALIVGNGPPD